MLQKANMLCSLACCVLLFHLSFTQCFTCHKDVEHCVTSLIIDNSFTMIDKDKGHLYTQNRTILSQLSGEEVDINNVISADGWNMTRKLITANGTMPGPDIIVHQNQKITIVVYNHLLSEEVSIHWHGIEQFGTPAMDGVPFVTQCPILPGQSFNYTFTPRIGGTYFYHSHSGMQFDLGLFGAFIVVRKRDPIPLDHQYIVQLQDWNHLIDSETILKSTKMVNIRYHSVLINGKGEYEGNLAPLHAFYVNKNERYLFRLISVASNQHFLFSIPGIKFIVKETDGDEIQPIIVDKILLFTGERYDIELNLENVNEGVYDIFAHSISGNNLNFKNESPGHAYLHVINNNSMETPFNVSSEQITILNCPFVVYPAMPNWTCIPLSALKTLNRSEQIHLTQKTNKQSKYFLNLSFVGFKTSGINGRIFKMPTIAPLAQASEIDTSCYNCGAENSCFCSHSINLDTGSEVIFVFLNIDIGPLLMVHPVHIHGHKFQVLKIGLTSVNSAGVAIPTSDIKCSDSLSNAESLCYNARWSNDTWAEIENITEINLQNGVYKDTVAIPPGGYAILRIWATNPGVWSVHCHRSLHLASGMNAMLNESFENQRNFLPWDLPTCRNFYNRRQPSHYVRTTRNPTETSYDVTTKRSHEEDINTVTNTTTSLFGDGGQTTALVIIIIFCTVITIQSILLIFTIRKLRK